MSMRSLVLEFLSRPPSGRFYTATNLSRILECKLPSLSSVLKKMCDRGELVRIDKMGPRGGYVYRLRGEK